MADLSAHVRNAYGPAKFALPGKRAFPIPDKAHAADAKARASEEANKGRLTAAQKAEIDRKADAVLKR